MDVDIDAGSGGKLLKTVEGVVKGNRRMLAGALSKGRVIAQADDSSQSTLSGVNIYGQGPRERINVINQHPYFDRFNC